MTFKTYHASLAKMDSLKSLLTNPNARVAAGEKGQSLLKRFQASQVKEEAPKVGDETSELLKKLISAKLANTVVAAPKPVYEAPKLMSAQDNTMALLKELIAKQAPKMVDAPQATYQMPPQSLPMPAMYPVWNPQPVPAYPVQTIAVQPPTFQAQVQAPTFQAAEPKPDLQTLPKEVLVQLLLAQLSKPDLNC